MIPTVDEFANRLARQLERIASNNPRHKRLVREHRLYQDFKFLKANARDLSPAAAFDDED